MKKKIIQIILLLTIIILPKEIFAASANIKISAPSSVYIGDTVTVNVTISSSDSLGSWQYNVNYDAAMLGDSNQQQMIASYAENGGKKTVTNTWTFTAKKTGTVTFSIPSIIVYAFDDDSEMTLNGSKSANIKINQPNTISNNKTTNTNQTKPSNNYKYSENNNLSSLVIEGFELEFDKNKTEYSITVPNETKNIKIGATAEDGKSTVNGIGDYTVKEGDNQIEITVTAENGDKKIYKLNIIVEEAKKIEIKIGEDTYTVIRKEEQLPEKTATYESEKTLVKGEEVPCYHSKITDIYLVALRDKEGNINLYRYDIKEDKFYEYNELQIGGIYIALLETETPEGYNKNTIKIDGKEYTAYTKENSYPLLYGINLETGEKNFYSYDESELTIQKLLKTATTSSTNKKSIIMIYGLVALCILEFIILIISINSKNKKLKKILKTKLNTKTEYEKSLEQENNKKYEEENIEEQEATESSLYKNEIDPVSNEQYGYTAYVKDSVSNVFENTKKNKKIKKKKNSDDDEMFQF